MKTQSLFRPVRFPRGCRSQRRSPPRKRFSFIGKVASRRPCPIKDNRDFCLTALRKLPAVTVPEPEGAFYVFPRIAGLTDSFDFCRRLLEETSVGLAPGVAFGAGGEGSLRICYAAERSILEPAMERLAGFLRSTP